VVAAGHDETVVRSSRGVSVPVLTGAEPFAADGGSVGVVVSHGFTATPRSVLPWAQHLAAAGYTVRLPLLPGHGTTWQDANRSTWQQWYAEIRRAHAELAARCDTVFAAGLSMGGTLVTRLAEEVDDLAGLVLVNPSLATERFDAKFARYVGRLVPSRPGFGSDIKAPHEPTLGYDRTPIRAFASLQRLWRATRADLHRITAPVLMFRSVEDHVVEPLSGRLLQLGATSTTVREVLLENSYHVATMDHDAPLIFAGSVDFIREHSEISKHGDVVSPAP
jgi:carboxylesterase